jgi:hypothetical protein
LCSIEEITENITSQKRKKRYWNIIWMSHRTLTDHDLKELINLSREIFKRKESW